MEELLHYAWKHKIFPLHELRTPEGEPVEIIDPGLKNTDAGPDFFNAKLRIGETLWVGNVEIHRRSSDWVRHGHATDPAYDSVILHAAAELDADVFDCRGRRIPQLLLPYPARLAERYDELLRADHYPPCHIVIPTLPRLTVHGWMAALQYERLEQKRQRVMECVERCEHNWEDAFFVTLARNFGFGLNSDVFERWGHSIPLRALDKHRDDLFQIEALFFGQAGLLEEDLCAPYYERLQKEYLYLAHKFDLRRMEAASWRLLRTRPGNFPHVRIAQMAWLFYREHSLLSRLLEADDFDAVRRIFTAQTSEYWDTHYTFTSASPRRRKTLSRSTQDLLIINTLCPFLFAYGAYKADERLTRRALDFLERLKPEANAIIRQWQACGLTVESAADSQALIQLKREYCDAKKCLRCRFGYEYLKGKPLQTSPEKPLQTSPEGRL